MILLAEHLRTWPYNFPHGRPGTPSGQARGDAAERAGGIRHVSHFYLPSVVTQCSVGRVRRAGGRVTSSLPLRYRPLRRS